MHIHLCCMYVCKYTPTCIYMYVCNLLIHSFSHSIDMFQHLPCVWHCWVKQQKTPNLSEKKKKKHPLCKFALEYSVLCLDQQHFLLCLQLNICRLCPQGHSKALLCSCSDPAGKRPQWAQRGWGDTPSEAFWNVINKHKGAQGGAGDPGTGRFVYGELGGIKWAGPGRGETSWIRVRTVATCSLNGSELRSASSMVGRRWAGWRLIPWFPVWTCLLGSGATYWDKECTDKNKCGVRRGIRECWLDTSDYIWFLSTQGHRACH